MGMGALLDVAVSVLAVMILFSLAASAINEVIADNIMRLRGKTLEQAIRGLLERKRDEGAPASATVENFYDDPDIRVLMEGMRKPSAIEPRRYALTVLNLLGKREALERAAQEEIAARKAQAEAAMREVAATLGAGALTETATARLAEAFDAAAARVAGAATALDARIAVLETEFREAMDRASGWYLRKVKVNLFVIGLILAVGANIDFLRYADRLMTEASARERAATYAQLLGPDRLAGALETDDASAMADVGKEVNALLTSLEGMDVRVGWDCEALPEDEWTMPLSGLLCEAGQGHAMPSPSKLIGWLIVAFGVTLGARFWLDLFRKAVSLRSAGLVGGAASRAREA